MLSALNPRYNAAAFRELILLLTKYRHLTFELARREIADRYAGQVFGMFWSIGHPLIMIAVYIFIFGYVFRVKVGGTVDMPLDYTTYLLSGLIPWLAFQDSMVKASTVIVSNTNLVKQVVFPIEVLPVKVVLGAFVTQIILLVLLILYILLVQHTLSWTFFLLPLLIIIQAIAMAGVSFILSAIGVYFRDIKDFIQVFSMIGIYLVPAFYLPDFVPKAFRGLLYINPFSYLIWCYQDILYFGRFEHPYAWLVLTILSFGSFIIGYRLFRKLRTMFGNVL